MPDFEIINDALKVSWIKRLKGQMNQNFDILSLAILKQPNARRTHY